MAATSVAALRALIQQRFPDATPLTGGSQTTEQVATGISALDKVLPNGGLPRAGCRCGRRSGGATAILRAACHSVVAAGERAAWIDGDSTWPARSGTTTARTSCGPRRASTRCAPRRSCSAPAAFHFSYWQVLNRTAPRSCGSRARRARAAPLSSRSAPRRRWRAFGSRRACCAIAGAARRSAIPRAPKTPSVRVTREPSAGTLTQISHSGHAS